MWYIVTLHLWRKTSMCKKVITYNTYWDKDVTQLFDKCALRLLRFELMYGPLSLWAPFTNFRQHVFTPFNIPKQLRSSKVVQCVSRCKERWINGVKMCSVGTVFKVWQADVEPISMKTCHNVSKDGRNRSDASGPFRPCSDTLWHV